MDGKAEEMVQIVVRTTVERVRMGFWRVNPRRRVSRTIETARGMCRGRLGKRRYVPTRNRDLVSVAKFRRVTNDAHNILSKQTTMYVGRLCILLQSVRKRPLLVDKSASAALHPRGTDPPFCPTRNPLFETLACILLYYLIKSVSCISVVQTNYSFFFPENNNDL